MCVILISNYSVLFRKAVVQLLEKPSEPVRIGTTDLEHYLGAPVFRDERMINGAGGSHWLSLDVNGRRNFAYRGDACAY